MLIPERNLDLVDCQVPNLPISYELLLALTAATIIKVDIVQTRARFLSSPNSNFFVVDPRVYLLPGEMMVLV